VPPPLSDPRFVRKLSLLCCHCVRNIAYYREYVGGPHYRQSMHSTNGLNMAGGTPKFARIAQLSVFAGLLMGLLALTYHEVQAVSDRQRETDSAAHECKVAALKEAHKEFGESLPLTARVQSDVIRLDDTGTSHACGVVVAGMPDKLDYRFSVMVSPGIQTATLSN
jgi:hypothetical protein